MVRLDYLLWRRDFMRQIKNYFSFIILRPKKRIQADLVHGRPQGRARGALAPPGRPRPAKNSMFSNFFGKNSIFFVVPLEKSLRTPMTSLDADFLSANSRLCVWKLSVLKEPILYFTGILGLFICKFIICKPNFFGPYLTNITRTTCTVKPELTTTSE